MYQNSTNVSKNMQMKDGVRLVNAKVYLLKSAWTK